MNNNITGTFVELVHFIRSRKYVSSQGMCKQLLIYLLTVHSWINNLKLFLRNYVF